jgi:hypothetical protein
MQALQPFALDGQVLTVSGGGVQELAGERGSSLITC